MEKNYILSPETQDRLDRFKAILRKHYGVDLDESKFIDGAVDGTIRTRLALIIDLAAKGVRVTDTGALGFYEPDEARDRELRELLDDVLRNS